MPLYASGVKIDPTLSGALSGAGSPGYNAYNTISSNYNKAKGQFGQDATARGMNGPAATGPGSYAGDQFTKTQGLDVGNLESALGGGLGNTAYNNQLQQREYGQNVDLANLVGSLNKPDQLQQILSGIGNVGGTAAQIYGAWGRNNRGGGSPGYGGGPQQGDLSLLQGYGGSRYGF